MDTEKAWAILIEKKSERRESRPAFLAALFMERAREQGQFLTPFQAQAFAAELVALAGSIKALAEAACNYELSAGQVKREARLSARFEALGQALGFRPETSGDPRGPVCRLFDPKDDRAGDGWGGGWAVYA
jgi:hypothetical protein